MATYKVNWDIDSLKNLYLNKKYNERSSWLYSYLNPFCNDIYSEFNPSFLFLGQDINIFSVLDNLQIRDGLIPLIIFFEFFQSKDFTGKIYIHRDFAFVVPDHWKHQVLYYEYKVNLTYSKKSPPETIILSGILNNTLANLEEAESILLDYSEKIGKDNFKKANVIAYMPSKRNDLWGNEDENVLGYTYRLLEHFGKKVSFPTWNHLSNIQSFKKTAYVELNSGHLIKDSYLFHFFISKGAGIIEPLQKVSGFQKVHSKKISAFHEIEIFEKKENLKKENDLSSEIVGLREALFNERFLSPVWEQWMRNHLEKYYKLNRRKM